MRRRRRLLNNISSECHLPPAPPLHASGLPSPRAAAFSGGPCWHLDSGTGTQTAKWKPAGPPAWDVASARSQAFLAAHRPALGPFPSPLDARIPVLPGQAGAPWPKNPAPRGACGCKKKRRLYQHLWCESLRLGGLKPALLFAPTWGESVRHVPTWLSLNFVQRGVVERKCLVVRPCKSLPRFMMRPRTRYEGDGCCFSAWSQVRGYCASRTYRTYCVGTRCPSRVVCPCTCAQVTP